MKNRTKAHAAFAYCYAYPNDLVPLKESLRLLDKNFNNFYGYPVIILHQGLSHKHQEEIVSSSDSNIYFQEIAMDNSFEENEIENDKCYPEKRNEMISCAYNVLLNKSTFKDIEYFCRLEPDSYILKKINYDIFEYMKSKSFHYGSVAIRNVKAPILNDLREHAYQCMQARGRKNLVFPNDMLDNRIFETGFEIFNLGFWKTKEINDFTDLLIACTNDYNKKYSEPACRSITVSTFIPQDKVHIFNDVAYWNRGFVHKYGFGIHYRTKLAIKRMKAIKMLNNLSDTLKKNKKEQNNAYENKIYDYKGFDFFYNKDGVRANLMKDKNWTYDKEISKIIVTELKRFSHPSFVDIGAHLGFITLNIISEIEDVNVYAFEPGPFQNTLLEKTIKMNNLEDKVSLFKEALSRETGETTFCCQELPDADWSMGNGLIDTKRGKGLQHSIKVNVEKLDNWWEQQGKPCIDVIKMDTEGAELWILEGGAEFLDSCRPTLLLEIQPLNLHAYPYGAKDVFLWLNENDYRVETINGLLVTPLNFKDVLRNNENFIARHRFKRGG